jgi:hypothetical protein
VVLPKDLAHLLPRTGFYQAFKELLLISKLLLKILKLLTNLLLLAVIDLPHLS